MERRKTSTPTQLHVGAARAAEVATRATSVAYHTKRQCKPTDFIRALIDRYAARLETELVIEATNPPQPDQAGQAPQLEHQPGD